MRRAHDNRAGPERGDRAAEFAFVNGRRVGDGDKPVLRASAEGDNQEQTKGCPSKVTTLWPDSHEVLVYSCFTR